MEWTLQNVSINPSVASCLYCLPSLTLAESQPVEIGFHISQKPSFHIPDCLCKLNCQDNIQPCDALIFL